MSDSKELTRVKRRWGDRADGFYFARSLRLIRHIFAHPEMLDRPLGEDSGFEY